MAQQLKVLATKLDELSLIPRSRVVEGRTNLEGCSLVSTCVVTHAYTHAKSNILFFKNENSCHPVEMGTGRLADCVSLPNQRVGSTRTWATAR